MKKIICLLLSAICLFSLVACGEKSNKGETDGVATYENEANLEKGCIRINGYESQRDLDTLLQHNWLGRTSLETEDSTKIKSGGASAKVLVMPDPFYGADSGIPQIYQAMKNVSRGVNCMDFRNVDKVQFWIYNAQDFDDVISFGLEYEEHYSQGQSSEFKDYTIVPGWNFIEYEVDTSLIPEVTTAPRGDDRNGEGEMILRVCGVTLRFLNRPASEEPEKIYYIDEFVVCKKTV